MKTFYTISKGATSTGLLLLVLSTTFVLAACSGLETTPPETPEEPVSVFTGKPGGIKLFGDSNQATTNVNMPVNALLWRAALDIASFVPLDDVDTFGGSIVTEWYQSADSSDERLKLVFLLLALSCGLMQSRFKPTFRKNWAMTGLIAVVMMGWHAS